MTGWVKLSTDGSQLWEALGMLVEVVFLVTVLVIGSRVLPLNVEMDVTVLVHMIRNLMLFNLMLEPLLSNCWNLLTTFPNSTVDHIFREANTCANNLAKIGKA